MNQSDKRASHPKKTCIQLLQSILDGEATAEERQDFLDRHLENCMPCYQNYHLEMAIRELLKTKCNCQQPPADLIENIRGIVNHANK
jgi:anti-sigma factor (TIGR02949 family)